ncbi:uncharacterized protein E6C27_scaffold114G00410 [Cucumis melo var. makuwa]|uniref:Uncharacterized protein n=1 Tax=Cucumis melo var. makuwa TaxID=1194695 RepID=A0A5A7TYT7_CUCMM|nr:uncharacterized protein E6C27_scaffold114G00410 [Cucumis melo var. makuwa]
MKYVKKGQQERKVYPRNCGPQTSNKDKGLREERGCTLTISRSAGLYEEIQRDTHLVNVEYTWVKDSIVLKYMMGELPDYGTINVWDSCIDLMLQVSLDKELDNMRCIVSTLLHCNGVFIVKLNLPSTLWLVYHV